MRKGAESVAWQTRGEWTAVGLWLVLQLTLTSLPGSAIPINLPHPLDWIGHFSMYFGLGFLVARAGVLRSWPARRLLLVALVISVFAALDELHQLLIPGRDAEVGDWIVDTLGGSLGLSAGWQVMASRFGSWLR